jgi:adenosylcobinamide hydrolase
MPHGTTPDWMVPELVAIPVAVGASGALLVWRFTTPVRAISSAILGGGLTRAQWVVNMTVDSDYSRFDPAEHLVEVAHDIGLVGAGVGLLTAVNVSTRTTRSVEGATVTATVGVSRPIWAHDADRDFPERTFTETRPGTINLVCGISDPLTDAALVNAISTITEAKAQALADRGVSGTGTASDSICLLCPEHDVMSVPSAGGRASAEEIFGGPLSFWGSRLARATYEAVSLGLDRQRQQIQDREIQDRDTQDRETQA